jgi:hypothetical protein
MKTKLLLPVILLSTISLAYAGGRTPPANGNSNSSKPTQAEVTGEPSKGASFEDDGSEGVAGDAGVAYGNASPAVCAAFTAAAIELSQQSTGIRDAMDALNCAVSIDDMSDACQELMYADFEIDIAKMELELAAELAGCP